MSRKNLMQFDSSPRDKTITSETRRDQGISNEDSGPSFSNDIPVNPVSRALRGIEEKAARSNEYDEKVAAGLVIYELDHDLIDFSFIKDRIDLESNAIADLATKISQSGQNSPILVRPHPKDASRYQIVYGHRRYLATKTLGIKVKAIIRSVNDRDLIIAQGQENNDHVGLSFIERAQFALSIRKLGHDMNVVMQAINANQSLAYKMIGIAEKAGMPLITAIGAAPNIGRRRWEELTEKLNEDSSSALEFLKNDEVQDLSSDERFEKLIGFLTSKRNDPAQQEGHLVDSTAVEKTEPSLPKTWSSPNDDLLVHIKPSAKSFDLTFRKPQSHKFGLWLTSRINQLYNEFEKENDMK